MASTRVSSDTSRAPASTIITESSVAATTRSSVLRSRSAKGGFTTRRPSICPMRTAPNGPRNGSPATSTAADAPFIARMPGSFSWSDEIASTISWISFLKPLGKSGRSGRSISREVRISFSAGRPSRLKKPPGMRPPA